MAEEPRWHEMTYAEISALYKEAVSSRDTWRNIATGFAKNIYVDEFTVIGLEDEHVAGWWHIWKQHEMLESDSNDTPPGYI